MSLPRELIRSILSYLEDDTTSLLSCSLTDIQLSSFARGVLFRNVGLDALIGKTLCRKYAAFREALLTSSTKGSSLARSIRSLCLRFGKGFLMAQNQNYDYQLEKDATLPSTLSLIVNLRSLIIHNGSDELVTFPTALRPSLLTLFSSPSLRNLELRGIKRMDDVYLQHFTNLQHLKLVGSFLKTVKNEGEDGDDGRPHLRKCRLESISVFSCHKSIFHELAALSSSPTSGLDLSGLRYCHFLFAPSSMPWNRKDRGIDPWNVALQSKDTLEYFQWHRHPSFPVLPLCLDISVFPLLRHLSIALEPTLFIEGDMGNTPQVLDLATPGNAIEYIEIGMQLSENRTIESFTSELGKRHWMELDTCLASTHKFAHLQKAEIVLFIKSINWLEEEEEERYREKLMLNFPLLPERGCGVFCVEFCPRAVLYSYD
ncbi:hypothetical protein K443DRAFT_128868 [Laccaria amethystina LaAM-08-1]|uniref:F-box domain-containing protein n=1 Tax=Laccaria amethystina LaAM-08-1 TaxID=1095629 RepID=A0A0C9YBS0_9AGAR|nr:hypothetical protein K443DRAFT_128868 [Laccaria amethystina LaAM-08-1]